MDLAAAIALAGVSFAAGVGSRELWGLLGSALASPPRIAHKTPAALAIDERLLEEDRTLLMRIPVASGWISWKFLQICSDCRWVAARTGLRCDNCGSSSFYHLPTVGLAPATGAGPMQKIRLERPISDDLRKVLTRKWGTPEQKQGLKALDALTTNSKGPQ
jgi:hypothetical protein